MRFLKVIFVGLLFSSLAPAQTSVENFRFVGKFDFENPNERILTYKPLDGGRLQLIGSNTFQIWDTANNKVLESRRHAIENLVLVWEIGGALETP